MLIEIIIALLLGVTFGIITGLIPGIHINLISFLAISISSSLLVSINPIYFVVFITSMAITHTFVDFIPSTLLGCPDTDTELSILPAHDLLKKGRGYEAILLTCYGSLAAIFILILIAYPSIILIQKIQKLIQNIIPYILITTSIFLISLENKKFSALFAFFLTGFLGWSVLNLGVKEPLLPLLAGLFGSSNLILSIKNKTQIPEQIIQKPKPILLRPLTGALLASPLCSFLPGLGSGQAAIIGNTISRNNNKGFLTLLGATNTLVMGFSFISLYAISKTRTGAALAVSKIITPSSKIILLIIITMLISGIISFFLTTILAKILSKKINNINYIKISIITLIILAITTSLISGFLGLIILIVSTLTGIYCISLNVKRTNMMGCLLLPTILFYLI
jgi:putative membrane protein